MATLSRTFNIPEAIVRQAEVHGLDLISTGGGFDYVWRDLGDDKCLVLSGAKLYESPPNLSAAAIVTIHFDEDWTQSVSISFPTALAAMIFMAGRDFSFCNF